MELKLVSNNPVPKDAEPVMTIKLSGTAMKYTEFVAFGWSDEKNDLEYTLNADALTLLKSLVLLQQMATEAFNALSPDMKDEVRDLVWGAGANENNT